jgi:multiple sugar transport system substrate-binding protein
LADPERAEQALEFFAELLAHCHPVSMSLNPIKLLELMARTNEVAYMPLTFGYVNYSTPGFRPHPIAYGSIPVGAEGISGGVLGGAGLGISARSRHIGEAAQFLQFVATGAVQASEYVAGGGQPGHRSAWLDPAVNARHGDFFANTLSGIDGAYLRPRWPGYLPAQTAAAEMIHSWLIEEVCTAKALVKNLGDLFSAAFQGSAGLSPPRT